MERLRNDLFCVEWNVKPQLKSISIGSLMINSMLLRHICCCAVIWCWTKLIVCWTWALSRRSGASWKRIRCLRPALGRLSCSVLHSQRKFRSADSIHSVCSAVRWFLAVSSQTRPIHTSAFGHFCFRTTTQQSI